MTPDEIIEGFTEATRLLARFRIREQRQGNQRLDLIIDAKTRVDQASYLLRQFRDVQLEHKRRDAELNAFQGTERLAKGVELLKFSDLIRLYGEAFYYFAFRAWKALGAIKIEFTPVGVRNVRNHLIEHPSGKKGVLVTGWIYGPVKGLQLGRWNAPHGSFVDPGLYPNAEEFIQKLLPSIRKL